MTRLRQAGAGGRGEDGWAAFLSSPTGKRLPPTLSYLLPGDGGGNRGEDRGGKGGAGRSGKRNGATGKAGRGSAGAGATGSATAGGGCGICAE